MLIDRAERLIVGMAADLIVYGLSRDFFRTNQYAHARERVFGRSVYEVVTMTWRGNARRRHRSNVFVSYTVAA